jgi:hypothetical protein
MNIKRAFGVLLTILGITGLIYPAVMFINKGAVDSSTLAMYGVLGLLFFISGVGLVRSTKAK